MRKIFTSPSFYFSLVMGAPSLDLELTLKKYTWLLVHTVHDHIIGFNVNECRL